MLENMRRQGASVFLYLVFGLLIAIFVININPGSNQSSGCSTGGNALVTVDGSKVGKSAYMVAYSNQFIPTFMRMWSFKTQKEREFAAVELLIRRELLAMAAADRGMRVTDEMVMEEIKKGYFFIGGERIALGDRIFDIHEDGTKTWNLNKFKNWVGSMNVSRNSYLEEQARGMQAALMRELLVGAVRVSKEEARDSYIHSKTTVSYDVVAFQPRSYVGAMKLTDADISRYLKDHEDEVKAKFKTDERKYKAVKPSLKLRQIFIAKAEEKKPEEKKPEEKKPEEKDKKPGAGGGSAAGAGSGSAAGSGSVAKKPDDKKPDAKKDDAKKDAKTAKTGAPKKPVGLPIEEAKTKLEAARAAVIANKRKFADAATELSTDEVMKATGGDLGWRTADNAQLGDKSLNEQVKDLKPGQMTPVIPTDKGVYLILVEDKRPVGDKKDLDYDQVKMEIAAELAKVAWSKEAAKRAAIAALTAAKDKNLADLYEESFDDKIRRKVEADRAKAGAAGIPGLPEGIDFETPDEPMAWKPGDDAGGSGTGGSASAPTGSGSAKPAAGGVPTGSGSAGSAGSAAGVGSGSGAPAPAPTPKPTAPGLKDVEPTKDVLPAFGDVPKPNLKKYLNIPRMPQVPGLPKELVATLFDDMVAGTLANRVYESDGAFVIVQVTAKGSADMTEFEKAAAGEIAKLRLFRSGFLVEDWLKSKCEGLAKDEKIRVPEDLKLPDKPEIGVDGKPLPVPPTPGYRTCMTFSRQ